MEIIRDLPFDEYKKRPGVNASLLKTVHRYSLAHARAYLDGKDERESDALDFGTAFHALLLEGRKDYAVQPDTYPAPVTHEKVKKLEVALGAPLPWNSNAGHCKQWVAKQGGKSIFTAGEASEIEAMVASIKANSELAPMLAGDRELSIFAERDGIPTKARIDLLPKAGKVVIDFKKARSAEPEKFLRQALDLGYHMQCAWLLDVLRAVGVERSEVWMVAIEQTYPHAVGILKFSDGIGTFLRVGRIDCNVAFHRLREAHQTNSWPDYGSHEAELFAPAWWRERIERTA